MKYLLTALIICFATCSIAQTPVTISGTIYDSAHLPASNVTVLLNNSKDTLVVKGTITNKTGEFKFLNIKKGSYIISASLSGYKKIFSTIIKVDSASNIVLPEMKLEREIKQLSGINIVAKKPLIEQADDKIIYNTESDPMAASETAIDILKKTPLVTVNADGAITVNGQSNFKVLLNGRETSMFARNVSDALKGFPGKLISKIEVITSPSAKYDAEGVGGIINIVTKKKVSGYNGSVNASINSNGYRGGNLSFNYKLGKFGVTSYGGYSSSINQKRMNYESIEAINPTVFYKRNTSGNNINNFNFIYSNIEANYEIDSFNTVSSYISAGTGSQTADGESLIDFVRPNITDTLKSTLESNSKDSYPSSNIGMDYIRKFRSNPDKEFSIKINSDKGHDDSYSNSSELNSQLNRFIINDNKALNKQYTIQSDVLLPLKKSRKVEFGAKAILRNAVSDYVSLIKYTPTAAYVINQQNSNFFTYKQNVVSLYSTYNFQVKTITFRVGLRAEHTNLNGYFKNTSTTVDQNYTNLIPNILISNKFKKGQNLSFTYNMRLSRPYIWNLNPFVNNTDSFSVSTGNPALKPQTFHTFQLQYRFSSGKNFFNIGLLHTTSHNQIINYYIFNQATSITTSIPENIGYASQSGLSLSVNGKFTNKWSFNLNGRVQYDVIKNTSVLNQMNSGLGGNIYFNTSYKFNKHFTGNGYLSAYRSSVGLQTSSTKSQYYGTGVAYKFYKEKFSLNVSIVNFHEKYFYYKYYVTDANFKRLTRQYFPYRTIQLGLNYNFGKLSENVSKKRGVSNDDLMAK